MNKIKILFLILNFLMLSISPVWADLTLFDYDFNYDLGTIDETLFDPITGTGTIVYETDTSGYFLAFFDYEMTEAGNTYFNEYGYASGSPGVNQSWEIDEPGYLFGDIWDNYLDNTLDNSNSVPAGSEDDVSMAMGWNFDLEDEESAAITLLLSLTAPADGFYLAHRDELSQESIFFSGSIVVIRGGSGGDPVPEPTTMVLLGTGLIGLAGSKRWIRKK